MFNIEEVVDGIYLHPETGLKENKTIRKTLEDYEKDFIVGHCGNVCTGCRGAE